MVGDDSQFTEPPAQSRESSSEPPGRPAASRRRLLAAGGGAAAALLAGCSGIVPGGDGTDDAGTNTTDTTATATDDTTPTKTRGTPTPEVDVKSLSYNSDGTTYAFAVKLSAPGETDGADWWQVETLDGTKLGRKEFESPVAGRKFTTSAEVTVEQSVSGVVVRGHDATTGYGGQAMLADLDRGYIVLEKQGSEPVSFENYSF